ncbi:MAG TPA: imidazole glycerol phosphate synthase subunit HisF [Microscillaceae bacterium]|nr:imidazole glycerol phosphate synthase subunit HisF [Microscillaceae bacterium]
MLKTRIIPTLLWKDYGLVKGQKFDSWRVIGSILPSVKVFNTRQVDELVILDISATQQQRKIDFKTIKEVAGFCFVPLSVGGGIRDVEDAKELLRSGADKVVINSVCYENPDFITELSKKFGSQCVVVSIDVKKHEDGKYYCYSHAGTVSTGQEMLAFAKMAEEKGAGEIILNDIERDGVMNGYNLEITKQVSEIVNIPLIISGGAGRLEDFSEAFNEGANALAAAAIFQFTQVTPMEIKDHLKTQGIPVRK